MRFLLAPLIRQWLDPPLPLGFSSPLRCLAPRFFFLKKYDSQQRRQEPTPVSKKVHFDSALVPTPHVYLLVPLLARMKRQKRLCGAH